MRGLEAIHLAMMIWKGFCAAFGTTSGMPLLHIAGHTRVTLPPLDDADIMQIDQTALAQAWRTLNADVTEIDLVAIGSPTPPDRTAADCQPDGRAQCQHISILSPPSGAM